MPGIESQVPATNTALFVVGCALLVYQERIGPGSGSAIRPKYETRQLHTNHAIESHKVTE
jgi:hypothetical protein